MHYLFDGLKAFRNQEFEEHRELFQQLKEEQNPHTMFITCSDSRIDPNMMTSSLPGDLFILRNVANIIPAFEDNNLGYAAIGSAVEYAVSVLKVKNIIVCGHSHCGGCKAAYAPEEDFAEAPHTRHWISLLDPVKQEVAEYAPDADEETRRWLTETANVVHQLENLRTYPPVKVREDAGKLALAGWYYIIDTGEVFAFDEKSRGFTRLLNKPLQG